LAGKDVAVGSGAGSTDGVGDLDVRIARELIEKARVDDVSSPQETDRI